MLRRASLAVSSLALASLAACAASSLAIVGAAFALGYSCACARREPRPQSSQSTPGAARAASKSAA
jgi:hypothetical protein